jgi:hypothetical protein
MSSNRSFLKELEIILWSNMPIIVGANLNMVMATNEKSTGNVNRSMMHLINEFVSGTRLRELHRHGGSFTWTNK